MALPPGLHPANFQPYRRWHREGDEPTLKRCWISGGHYPANLLPVGAERKLSFRHQPDLKNK